MTELEILARNINGLTESLKVAWGALTNPHVSSLRRREAISQIDRYGAELCDCLHLMAQSLSRAGLGEKRQS